MSLLIKEKFAFVGTRRHIRLDELFRNYAEPDEGNHTLQDFTELANTSLLISIPLLPGI